MDVPWLVGTQATPLPRLPRVVGAETGRLVQAGGRPVARGEESPAAIFVWVRCDCKMSSMSVSNQRVKKKKMKRVRKRKKERKRKNLPQSLQIRMANTIVHKRYARGTQRRQRRRNMRREVAAIDLSACLPACQSIKQSVNQQKCYHAVPKQKKERGKNFFSLTKQVSW
mgnify:CR=1 FL=1